MEYYNKDDLQVILFSELKCVEFKSISVYSSLVDNVSVYFVSESFAVSQQFFMIITLFQLIWNLGDTDYSQRGREIAHVVVSVSVCQAGRPGSRPAACFRKVEFYRCAINLSRPVLMTGSTGRPCVIMSM